MSTNRVFSQEELKTMQTQLVDRIVAAIDAGELEQAKKLVRRGERAAAALCQALQEWVTMTLAYIDRNHGKHAVEASRRFSASTWGDEQMTSCDFQKFDEAKFRWAREVDKTVSAIDAGNHAEAKLLARRVEQQSDALAHVLEDWVAILLSYICEKHGGGAVAESLRDSTNAWGKTLHDHMMRFDFRGLVEAEAALFLNHARTGLSIVEDEEKVTLVLNPCNSGGRMVAEGKYDQPNGGFLRIREAQDITFGRKDFPAYCAHCAMVHHILPIEWSGAPFPPIEVGPGPGNPCKWHFYKDRAAIPARFYQQVGKQEPTQVAK